MAVLLALLAIWISAGLGRTLLFRAKVLDESGLLRFAYGGAIGLGVAAYTVLVIGLCGLLSFWPVTIVWIVFAFIGYRGMLENSKDAVQFLSRTKSGISSFSFREPKSLIAIFGSVSLVLIGSAAIITCFKPPAGLEWDAISYHLADPAQFLVAHRVFSIPTTSHSNFPSLMEMLYTVGLLYSGYVLANLFHLITAVLTVAAIFACCKRLGGSTCAWIAVVLFVSTPVVFWESSVAYVEIGLGLFSTLAVLAAVRGIVPSNQTREHRSQWLMLCAVCAGFALGIKYLALVPFGLIGLFIAVKSRSLRQTAVFVAIAFAVGSPWYIKNAVLLHNPIYPFYFKLFPHSVNWSAGRAAGYEAEQSRFGTSHSLKNPAVAASNLLNVPWDLVTLPLTIRGAYSNVGEFTFLTLIGGLVSAFNAILLLRKRISKEASAILLLGVVQVAAWFFIAQVSRYLVSILPLLAITGACGVSNMDEEVKSLLNESQHRVSKAVTVLAYLLLGAQVVLLLWVVVVAPSNSNIISLPQIAQIATSQDGVGDYLLRHLDTYAVTDWINKNTPKNAGVLIYDDTRGLYLDRRYMWANEEHSGYIPYATFQDGRQLTDWMLGNNYRYAMFDMNWAPQRNTDPNLPGGPNKNEIEAFQRWYASAPLRPVGFGGFRWRGLVADAYKRGLWTVVDGVAQRGVILLHIGPSENLGFRGNKTEVGAVGVYLAGANR